MKMVSTKDFNLIKNEKNKNHSANPFLQPLLCGPHSALTVWWSAACAWTLPGERSSLGGRGFWSSHCPWMALQISSPVNNQLHRSKWSSRMCFLGPDLTAHLLCGSSLGRLGENKDSSLVYGRKQPPQPTPRPEPEPSENDT